MKKTMPKFLLRTVVFLLCLALTFKAADFFLCDDVHDFSRAMLQEMYTDEENIDVLFLGPSHCYRSFDPAILDEELGQHAFNGGSSQQLYDGSYYMLREVAKTNRVQTVLLEVSNGGYTSSDLVPEACYLLADYMHPEPERWEYLWEMGGVAAILESFTPARHNTVSPNTMVEAWKAKLTGGYRLGNHTYLQTGAESYRGNGFVYVNYCINENSPLESPAPTNLEQVISAFSEEYLEKIIAYCGENEIELILVHAPMTDIFLSGDENRQAIVDYFTAVAAEHGLAYWDMNLCTEEYLQMGWADFSDAHHLSGQGAEKTTAALCRMLSETEAGNRAGDFFYETLAEKWAKNPDETLQ